MTAPKRSGPALALWLRFGAAFWPTIRFAILCGIVFTVAIGYGLYAKGFAPLPKSTIALAILAVPPAVAAGIFAYAIDITLPCAGRVARGLLMAALLAAFAPIASAGVFALQFRTSYPADFEPVWTETGFHQFVWTGIATLYMFAVSGLRLYLPWGPAALVGVAIYFALRPSATLRGQGPSAKPRTSDTENPKNL